MWFPSSRCLNPFFEANCLFKPESRAVSDCWDDLWQSLPINPLLHNSCMVVRYGHTWPPFSTSLCGYHICHQTWSSYMMTMGNGSSCWCTIIICDDHLRSLRWSCMITIYDCYIRLSCVVIRYDQHMSWSCMIIIYNAPIRASYAIITYPDHTWWSCIVIMHDRHIGSSYMTFQFGDHVLCYRIMKTYRHQKSLWYLMIIVCNNHVWLSCLIIIYYDVTDACIHSFHTYLYHDGVPRWYTMTIYCDDRHGISWHNLAVFRLIPCWSLTAPVQYQIIEGLFSKYVAYWRLRSILLSKGPES